MVANSTCKLGQSATVIVTGGTGGIGRTIVDDLDAKGYDVISVDLKHPQVEWDFEHGMGIAEIYHDVCDIDMFEQLLIQLRQSDCAVSFLVNCAAVLTLSPVVDMDYDSLRAIMKVNSTRRHSQRSRSPGI